MAELISMSPGMADYYRQHGTPSLSQALSTLGLSQSDLDRAMSTPTPSQSYDDFDYEPDPNRRFSSRPYPKSTAAGIPMPRTERDRALEQLLQPQLQADAASGETVGVYAPENFRALKQAWEELSGPGGPLPPLQDGKATFPAGYNAGEIEGNLSRAAEIAAAANREQPGILPVYTPQEAYSQAASGGQPPISVQHRARLQTGQQALDRKFAAVQEAVSKGLLSQNAQNQIAQQMAQEAHTLSAPSPFQIAQDDAEQDPKVKQANRRQDFSDFVTSEFGEQFAPLAGFIGNDTKISEVTTLMKSLGDIKKSAGAQQADMVKAKMERLKDIDDINREDFDQGKISWETFRERNVQNKREMHTLRRPADVGAVPTGAAEPLVPGGPGGSGGAVQEFGEQLAQDPTLGAPAATGVPTTPTAGPKEAAKFGDFLQAQYEADRTGQPQRVMFQGQLRTVAPRRSAKPQYAPRRQAR